MFLLFYVATGKFKLAYVAGIIVLLDCVAMEGDERKNVKPGE